MTIKILFARVFGLFFFLQVISPAAFAAELNLQAPDLEPPAINFELGGSTISDGLNTIEAEITDNIGVYKVTLYYKGKSDVSYKAKTMLLTGPDTYGVDIIVDFVISNRLEFYIRADDVSGNSVFEGHKFSPFAYRIVPSTVTDNVVTTVTEPPEGEEEGMSTLTMILIGLGLVALAAGGGGGGDSGPSTGTINITSDVPN